jgi:serine/threonine-protein kinase
MGTVWLAEQLSLGAYVAVKVMRVAGVADEEARARFAQEARRVASVHSPHVVRILDYGVTLEGEPFIVMELLRGRDLAHYIDAHGPLDLATTAELLSQLCRGLSAAHEQGIVHRDIKPANVILVDNDGRPLVKLVDFGVSKSVRQVETSMTATGALMGTPFYMSPEQFMGQRDIDERSDLWSVAVLAYSCLTGKLPFRGESVVVISMAAHAGEFAAPSSLRAELPAALDAWFARAFAVDRSQRFASARELSESFGLAAGLSNGKLDLSANPPPKAVDPFAETALRATTSAHSEQPPGPKAGPNRALIWGLSVAAVLGLLGTVSSLMYIVSERDVAPQGSVAAQPSMAAPSSATTTTVASLPSPALVAPVPASAIVPLSSTVAPASGSVPKSALPPVGTAAKKPKWRSRKSPCRRMDETKSCMPCCYTDRGDRMEPYPSCDCVFDGEKWDREHGIVN